VRKRSKAAVAIQLAHAGRKAPATCLGRRPVDPAVRRRLAGRGAVRRAAQGGRDAAARARCAGLRASARLSSRRPSAPSGSASTPRGALRARLSAASVPVADRQQAHRSVWRLACRTACAFRSKCSTRCARRFRRKSRSAAVSATDWVEGGWDLRRPSSSRRS
jgi:hypothetical protein